MKPSVQKGNIMVKRINNFTIEVTRNIYTSKTQVGITGPETKYMCKLKVGSETEVINNLLWTLGSEVDYDEAVQYFVNHPEKI